MGDLQHRMTLQGCGGARVCNISGPWKSGGLQHTLSGPGQVGELQHRWALHFFASTALGAYTIRCVSFYHFMEVVEHLKTQTQ